MNYVEKESTDQEKSIYTSEDESKAISSVFSKAVLNLKVWE